MYLEEAEEVCLIRPGFVWHTSSFYWGQGGGRSPNRAGLSKRAPLIVQAPVVKVVDGNQTLNIGGYCHPVGKLPNSYCQRAESNDGPIAVKSQLAHLVDVVLNTIAVEKVNRPEGVSTSGNLHSTPAGLSCHAPSSERTQSEKKGIPAQNRPVDFIHRRRGMVLLKPAPAPMVLSRKSGKALPILIRSAERFAAP